MGGCRRGDSIVVAASGDLNVATLWALVLAVAVEIAGAGGTTTIVATFPTPVVAVLLVKAARSRRRRHVYRKLVDFVRQKVQNLYLVLLKGVHITVLIIISG
jgi:hypothetical protein